MGKVRHNGSFFCLLHYLCFYWLDSKNILLSLPYEKLTNDGNVVFHVFLCYCTYEH